MSDGTPAGSATGGLRRALARAGTASVALLRTRLELASVEFQEQSARTAGRLVLLAVVMLAFGFAVLCASALVVVLFWDTHRVAAIACVTLFYVAVGAFALWRLSALQHSSPKPFAATLAEQNQNVDKYRKLGDCG